jgi:hypothetical protein
MKMNTTTQELLKNHPQYRVGYERAKAQERLDGAWPRDFGIPVGFGSWSEESLLDSLRHAHDIPIFPKKDPWEDLISFKPTSPLCSPSRYSELIPKLEEIQKPYYIIDEINPKLEKYQLKENFDDIIKDPFKKKRETTTIPLEDLARLLRNQNPKSDLDRDIETAAARLGYVSGINELIEEHHLPFKQLNPTDMDWQPNHECYHSGRSLGYSMNGFCTMYQLGFALTLVAKYGLSPETTSDLSDIPSSNQALNAFNAGRQGSPTRFNDDESIATKVVGADDVKKEHSCYQKNYRLGVQVMLAENGLTGVVNPDEIMHPEAMYTFRQALKGEKVDFYEPSGQNPEAVALRAGLHAYKLGHAMYKKHNQDANKTEGKL